MTTDIDIAIIQLRECAQSIGTYLPASSAATIAAAWDALAAERDTLANANTANVGLSRKAEAERDAALARVAELEGEEFTSRVINNNIALQTDLKCTRLEIQSLRAQLAEAKAEIERLRKLGYKPEDDNGR